MMYFSVMMCVSVFFFFKQKTAYEMRISDWSSDVCSSDLAGIEARIREICETRARYGYRRVHVLLRHEGWEIKMKLTHRIYNELGLQLRNKTPKRRVKAKLRE